jgi:hypothetical protein
MKALRIIGIILALSLMIGELWRSWGVGRPVAFILDDQLAGGLMIAAAIAVGRETIRSRTAFAAAWGIAAGGLYGSFFGKLFDPKSAQAGNWDIGVLTALLGLAFCISLAGLAFSIMLPLADDARSGAR